MDACQQALIEHLRKRFGIAKIRTIEEYAGELKNAQKLNTLCPAVLALYIDGNPLGAQKQHNFDLLVITRNRALDTKKNKKENLKLVSEIAKYLRGSFVFRPADESIAGSYEILRDETRAATILNDNQFCIVALSLAINDYT